MPALNPANRDRRAWHPEQGLSLIELIITLLLIAISAATITALLVSSLNFVESNKRYNEDLRAAQSCYESIMAIQQNARWRTDPGNGEPIAYSDCRTTPESDGGIPWQPINAQAQAANWIVDGPMQTLFYQTDVSDSTPAACALPTTGAATADGNPVNIQCRQVDVAGGAYLQFQIPVRGSNRLELVLPINP